MRWLTALALMIPAFPVFAVSDNFTSSLDPDQWMAYAGLPGGAVVVPQADAAATDGAVAELVYPGPSSPRKSGPRYGTAVEALDAQLYGQYQARLKTAVARPREGVVSAFFTYYNDGLDYNGDGVADNAEIDFEFLSAEPSAIYLTVWTDYEVIDGVERFNHVCRRVDLATGGVTQTGEGFEGSYGHLEEQPPLGWRVPGFDAGLAWHTYGFDWQAGAVSFWIDLEDGQGRRLLWDFRGEEGLEVPAIPAVTMVNLWHNANHWDSGGKAAPPAAAVSYRVDWLRY